MRVISEGGVWVAEDQAFYVGEVGEGNPSPDLTSPAPAGPAPAGPQHAAPHITQRSSTAPITQTNNPSVIRRKSTDPYTDAEISWVLEPGGILDQMAAAETKRPYRDPICRSGETIAERDERLRRFREKGSKGRRRLKISNDGAIVAVLVDELRFVVPGSEPRRLEIFAAGEECFLFPGRNVPDCDPEAAEIRGSLANCGRDVRTKVVVRLGGRLRIVSERQVKVA